MRRRPDMDTTRNALSLALTLSLTLASGCVVRTNGSGGEIHRAPRTTEVVVVDETVTVEPAVEVVIYEGCSSSLDCAWDEVCDIDGTCVLDDFCYSDSDCYADEHCGLDGLCYLDEWCHDDLDCGPGYACGWDDACWPEEVTYYGCLYDDECPAGSWCTADALCEALPCLDDFDCDAAAYCDWDGYCSEY